MAPAARMAPDNKEVQAARGRGADHSRAALGRTPEAAEPAEVNRMEARPEALALAEALHPRERAAARAWWAARWTAEARAAPQAAWWPGARQRKAAQGSDFARAR